jgi:hypothetical protein
MDTMWGKVTSLEEGMENTSPLAAAVGLFENADGLSQKERLENSCIECGRLIRSAEIKVMPPRYMLERDPSFVQGLVDKRVLCVGCYNNIRSTVRIRQKNRSHVRKRVRAVLTRTAIGTLLRQRH